MRTEDGLESQFSARLKTSEKHICSRTGVTFALSRSCSGTLIISTSAVYTHLDLRHLKALCKRSDPRAVAAKQKESVAQSKMLAAA